jgi:hypothetical protein
MTDTVSASNANNDQTSHGTAPKSRPPAGYNASDTAISINHDQPLVGYNN